MNWPTEAPSASSETAMANRLNGLNHAGVAAGLGHGGHACAVATDRTADCGPNGAADGVAHGGANWGADRQPFVFAIRDADSSAERVSDGNADRAANHSPVVCSYRRPDVHPNIRADSYADHHPNIHAYGGASPTADASELGWVG